jgi:hypothetical protein
MGAGVATQVLVRAGHKEGYRVIFLDKKGLAIRNGGVVSQVVYNISNQPITAIIPYGKADLLLGIDATARFDEVHDGGGTPPTSAASRLVIIEVIEVVTQKRDKPDPATFIGSGKAEEIASLVAWLAAAAGLGVYVAVGWRASGAGLRELRQRLVALAVVLKAIIEDCDSMLDAVVNADELCARRWQTRVAVGIEPRRHRDNGVIPVCLLHRPACLCTGRECTLPTQA